MKKTKRITLIVLTLALVLLTAFVTVALADGDNAGEATVGTYIAPLGAWQPNDSSVAYAIFATEADYLSAAAPITVSSDPNLTPEILRANTEAYFVFFNNITYKNTAAMEGMLAKGQNVTLNLAGQTLTSTSKIRVSSANTAAKLTFKNGFIVNDNQLQMDRLTEVRFENIDYRGAQFGYNSGASYIHLKDCKVRVWSTMPIYLGPHATSISEAQLIFENTDFIASATGIASTAAGTTHLKNNALISIYYNENYKCNWRIVFDSESSFTCLNQTEQPYWLSVASVMDLPLGDVPTVIFEKGFTFDAVSTPNFIYTSKGSGESVYTTGDSANAIKASIIVADPGSREKSGEWSIASAGEGLYKFTTPTWAWAIYESEAAYTAGTEPIRASEEAVLTRSDLNCASNSYIRIFTPTAISVPEGESWFYGSGSTVLDLNSGTVSVEGNLNLAENGKSVTLKNGTLTTTGTLALGSGNSVELNKLDLNAATISLGNGTSLNSGVTNLTLSSAKPFEITGTASITLASTAALLTSEGLSAPTTSPDFGAIFNVSAAAGASVKVTLDKASTFTAPLATSAYWVATSSSVSDGAVKVIMESGFAFGANIIPQFEYVSLGATNEVVKTGASAKVDMRVVLPATEDALANFEIINVGGDMRTFDTLAWELFTSEEAFKAGESSILGSSSTTISNTDIQSFGGTYLRVYKDINYYTASGENMLAASQALTIDLFGNTLTTSNKVRVSTQGVKADLTIKNGFIVNNNQLQIDRKASLILDNVTYTGTQFGYNSGASYIHVKDSTIQLSSTMPFYFGSHDKALATAEVIFENTDIILTASGIATSSKDTSSMKNNAIFTIYFNEENSCNWRIVVDSESSISCPNMKASPVLLSVLAIKEIPEGHVPTVIIEEGAAFNLATMPSFVYTSKSIYASSYVDGNAAGSIPCVIKRTEAGTDNEIVGTLYANPTEQDGLYSITTKKDYSGLTAWYCYDGSDIIKGVKVQYVDDITEPVLSLANMRAFPAGSRIELMIDLRVFVGGEKYLNYFANDLTLDLGGNTLYCDVRIDFGYHDGTSWRVSRFTITNGKLISNVQDNLIFGLPTETGSVTISNMEIIHTAQTHSTVHTYNGSVYIYNSTFNTTTSVFTPEATGAYPEFVMDNVTVTSGSTAVMLGVNGLTSGYKYVITNCNFVSVPVAIRIYNASGSTAANTLSITVSGCRINSSAEPISVESAIPGTVTVTLSDVWLSRAVSLASHHVLELAKGQIMMSLSNSEYAYRVAAIELPMRANLKLYSDLKLYFYIPTDTTVTSFTVAGVTYKISELTEKVELYGKGEHYVICIAELTPDTAAEVVWYDLEFVEDGATHTATAGYSVIDYISALLNTDYSYSVKRLACATAEYIAAAYDYKGVTSSDLAALRATAAYVANLPENKEATSAGLSLGAASAAVSSVQLDLGATMKLRLNLKSDYTGTLKVMDTEYVVNAGKVGELSYVELTLTAYEMYSERITVSVADQSASFSLSDYAASVAEGSAYSAKDRALVAAFYTYCAYADEYEKLANSN